MAVQSVSQHDHKFTWATAWDNTLYEGKSFSLPALDSVHRAFCRNMKRARLLGLFPIRLISLVAINEAARVEAKVNLGIPLDDPRTKEGHKDYDADLAKKVSDERKRLIEKWAVTDLTGFVERASNIGAEGIQNILGSPGREDEHEAVQASMASMVMGLWTAFESLMQDTWLIAVNTHPKPLADRILKTLDKEEQQKFLPGKLISDAGYDLRNCMGDLLLRKRSVDFQQLKNIRNAYNIAWAGAFESIFEAAHNDLANLEATRNLFAHKGGIIDKKFLDRSATIKGLSGAKEGNELLLSGMFVAHSANQVAKCSTDLLKGVDKWLSEQGSN